MATSPQVRNRDILERLDEIGKQLTISQITLENHEERLDRNDKLLRGNNGDIGLKAQVDANKKALDKIEKYFMAIMTAVSVSLVLTILKLIN